MNKLILACVAVLGCLGAVWAEDAGAPVFANRSAEWKSNLSLAVNDESKVAGAIQAMPEADRAAFAADVLGVLQTKQQLVADKAAWAKNYRMTAAALVAGAGGAKKAVLGSVAAGVVGACMTAESRELGSGDLPELGALAKSVTQQMKSEDRAAFANALIQATDKQKAADAATHKMALCAISLSMFAGAGDAKKGVVAEVFAVVAIDDLGAVAKSLSDAFNQRKNKLNNDDYLRLAVQYLREIAGRLAGQQDATLRFAYAVAAFLGGASNPAAFEPDLMGKIADLLPKVGATQESLATALTAARAGLTANAALVQGLYAILSPRTIFGVTILPPGNILSGEVGLPFVHENRPPGYQDQGIP